MDLVDLVDLEHSDGSVTVAKNAKVEFTTSTRASGSHFNDHDDSLLLHILFWHSGRCWFGQMDG